MPPVTYDTSIFTSYKPEAFPSGFLFSAVVIQELMASANDDSEMNRWAAARRAFEKEDRLIVPTAADWLMASKVLYWLMQKRKRRAGGKSPPLKTGASQRMALDALIAVSARRHSATVVTVN
jgi:predicted nucleic acid-binding protein